MNLRIKESKLDPVAKYQEWGYTRLFFSVVRKTIYGKYIFIFKLCKIDLKIIFYILWQVCTLRFESYMFLNIALVGSNL